MLSKKISGELQGLDLKGDSAQEREAGELVEVRVKIRELLRNTFELELEEGEIGVKVDRSGEGVHISIQFSEDLNEQIKNLSDLDKTRLQGMLDSITTEAEVGLS